MGSIPKTQLQTEGENQLLNTALWSPRACQSNLSKAYITCTKSSGKINKLKDLEDIIPPTKQPRDISVVVFLATQTTQHTFLLMRLWLLTVRLSIFQQPTFYPVMSCSSELVSQRGALFARMPLEIIALLCLYSGSKGKNPKGECLVPCILGSSQRNIEFNYINR